MIHVRTRQQSHNLTAILSRWRLCRRTGLPPLSKKKPDESRRVVLPVAPHLTVPYFSDNDGTIGICQVISLTSSFLLSHNAAYCDQNFVDA